VFKRFKQKLDHWAINAGYSTLPCPDPNPDQKSELDAILRDQNFFRPKQRVPELKFTNRWQFEFDSPVQLCCPENNRVHGWFLNAGKDWTKRPLVILMHGWNAELHYEMILPRLARRLRRHGMNAMAFELPLHSQRRPRSPHLVRNFISDHLPTMLHATRQSIMDIHSLLLWAKKQGCPGVAVWGFSLGAWLAGIYLTVSTDPDAGILTTPVTSITEAIDGLAFCGPIRAALNVAPIDTKFLDLDARHPVVPIEKILLQQAEYDSFVSHKSYEHFAQRWGITEWIRAKHSHISILVSGRAMQDGVDWLRTRFN
jgi:dienelactone hydrolase